MTKHKHSPARQSNTRSYNGPVAEHPFTRENQAAHGNTQVTEHCLCGATRETLINGLHEEYGPWSDPGVYEGTIPRGRFSLRPQGSHWWTLRVSQCGVEVLCCTYSDRDAAIAKIESLRRGAE